MKEGRRADLGDAKERLGRDQRAGSLKEGKHGPA